MIQFDYPWVWTLLPLPLLVYQWLPVFQNHQRRLRVPFTASFRDRIQKTPGTGAGGLTRLSLTIQSLVWILLLTAAARPVILEPPLYHLEPKRDLMLAIDFSQSMDTRDIHIPDQPDAKRLDVVKKAAATFIKKRPNDRIGLIAFGDKAFPLAPPTSQHDTLLRILGMTESGMAGANTALGDAIGVTLKLLNNKNTSEKVLILLTDGNDNRSQLDPLQAARIASERDLTIHTIGFGRIDAAEADAVDVASLEKIAILTGGQAFLATDQEALAHVYSAIDSMTPDNAKELKAQPHKQLFWIPALAAVATLLLQLFGDAVIPRLRTFNRKRKVSEAAK